jgi:hypothetical protein
VNDLWAEVSKRVLAEYAKREALTRPSQSPVCKRCGGPLFRKLCILCRENRW